MSKPTKEEITAEIEKLGAMKPTVLSESAFGDDHHAAIDAQIRVLNEAMDESEIQEKEWEPNVEDAAMEARRWLDDEQDDDSEGPPSDGWESLIR